MYTIYMEFWVESSINELSLSSVLKGKKHVKLFRLKFKYFQFWKIYYHKAYAFKCWTISLIQNNRKIINSGYLKIPCKQIYTDLKEKLWKNINYTKSKIIILYNNSNLINIKSGKIILHKIPYCFTINNIIW